jgi:hypothetical protein
MSPLDPETISRKTNFFFVCLDPIRMALRVSRSRQPSQMKKLIVTLIALVILMMTAFG